MLTRDKAKRILSSIIVVTIIFNLFWINPVFAATMSTTYSFDGYDVEYSVVSEWENHQTVEVKVSNFYYDESNQVFNCKYSNDIPFYIAVSDFFESLFADDIEHPPVDDDYDGYSSVILNAFEDTEYRTEYYEDFVEIWRNQGMDVDYDDYVTVLDLRSNLSNKDIISLSGHGMVFGGQSVFCLNDDNITIEKDELYNLDIETERVRRAFYTDGTSSYVVTDDFFTHYYGNDGLSGSFVFSEACMFMGGDEENGYDDTFANAFIDCGAFAVVGFRNSVMASYSRELMVYYFEELLNGETSSVAFKNAKEKYGYNDYEYRKPSFWEYIWDKDAFEKMGLTAYPHLIGNENAKLVKELQNGDWEKRGQLIITKPLNWKYTGDTRVLSKLGEIYAYGRRMVFISTGVGSQSGVDMSGTQGSTLYQTV